MEREFKALGIAELNEGVIRCKNLGHFGGSNNRPLSDVSTFHLFSISKFITAILVMKLCQEKILELDAPVNQYLFDWKLRNSDGSMASEVTLRHLLLHISGIVDAEDCFWGYRRSTSCPKLDELLNGTTPYNNKAVQADFKQGEKFEYSDGGFCVIQKVIEGVTHQGFEEAANQSIFAPLGLESTFFATDENMQRYQKELELVEGYDENGKEMEDSYVICPDVAASGLWSTPKELLLIVNDLFRSMDSKGVILEKQYVDELMYFHSSDFPWVGIGHFFDEPNCVVSKGWGEDAQSMLWIDCNKRRAISVAGNRDAGKPQEETQIGALVLRFKENGKV